MMGSVRIRICFVHLYLSVLSSFPGPKQTVNKSVELINELKLYNVIYDIISYMYAVCMCVCEKRELYLHIGASYVISHAYFIPLAKITSTLNL